MGVNRNLSFNAAQSVKDGCRDTSNSINQIRRDVGELGQNNAALGSLITKTSNTLMNKLTDIASGFVSTPPVTAFIRFDQLITTGASVVASTPSSAWSGIFGPAMFKFLTS